jgi:hypothetical protein
MSIKSSGFKNKNCIVKDIKCHRCGCIFDQSEDRFLYIVDLYANAVRFHARCPECICLPELDDLPSIVCSRIVARADCYRIQLKCNEAFTLSKIKKKTGRDCFFWTKMWWEIKCIECRKIHKLPSEIIKTLPDIAVSVVDQISAKYFEE